MSISGLAAAAPSPALEALLRPHQEENEASLINKGFLFCCVQFCSYQCSWQFSKTEMTLVGHKGDNCQISRHVSSARVFYIIPILKDLHVSKGLAGHLPLKSTLPSVMNTGVLQWKGLTILVS